MTEDTKSQKGRTVTIYITDQEWELLSQKVREQGQEGTEKQVTLFAKQWAKAGMRMPIRDELEQVMFKQLRHES